MIDSNLLLASLPTLEAVQAETRRRERNKIERYYPEEGPLRRDLYPKHTAFFEAGATNRERLMLAANRVGKTEGVGAYELVCHLTGRYPSWWKGRRFAGPIKAWAAGDTSKTVREIIQEKLLGPRGAHGTGMIPGDLLVHKTAKQGVSDAIDTIWIRHATGRNSVLVLKSYDQKREAFQGSEQHLIWLDEEPPQDIYTECLMRTMTTDGMVMLTFTPLQGLSDVVLSFLPDGDTANTVKFTVFCTWDEVPHLSLAVKDELWKAIPAHQRDARSKGKPALGAGAIYPVDEADIVVPDFEIPKHWPRAFGLDVGWKRTAAVWGALNRDTDVLHIYSEHYRGEAEPSVHVAAIHARGKWIRGAIDPASRGRSQVDGRQLFQMYSDLGLNLHAADNSVEAGIYRVWERLTTGRLRVFSSLSAWRAEYRLYRRDEKGRIIKERDHLMDATRYLEMELSNVMGSEPKPKGPESGGRVFGGGGTFGGGGGGWMA